jgi:hypothetical protein
MKDMHPSPHTPSASDILGELRLWNQHGSAKAG